MERWDAVELTLDGLARKVNEFWCQRAERRNGECVLRAIVDMRHEYVFTSDLEARCACEWCW